MLKKNTNKSVQKFMFAGVLLLGFVFLNAIDASAQTKTIAGEWDAAMNTPGGVRNFKIVFQIEGEKLTGTVKRASGDVPLVGTLKGKDLEFSYTVQYNGNNLSISMTGKFEGDSINGTVSFGESGQEDAWSAKRATETKPKAD